MAIEIMFLKTYLIEKYLCSIVVNKKDNTKLFILCS